ncbi:MAG: LpqB family beta-propeller domain-containing protein [Streptosporangiaceae bacterium]
MTSQLRRRDRSGWQARAWRARAWRARAWRYCLLTAAVAALAGCVGMPDNGPATEFTASPPSSQPNNDFIGLFPSAPRPGGSPWQIVQGFLVASANYPTYAALADDYLTASATKAYRPADLTVLSNFRLTEQSPTQAASGHREVSRATVQTEGTVQTTFGGSPQGQYFWPLNQSGADSTYTFDLVKVDGQWRISNPPSSRMLVPEDFQYYYQTRDLYFFGPQEEQTLVPNSVFVPLGTNEQLLVADLVDALSQDPKTPWLANAAVSQFPPQTKVLGVSVDGATATVNLGGAIAHAPAKTLWEVSAQLVWTLTSSTLPGSIQSVVLELNGQPWASRGPPCSGGPVPTAFQTLAAYQCYNPFPSAATSFYYVNGGQAWSRCGTEKQALKGSIGTIVPLVGHTGAYSSPDCGSSPYLPESQASQAPPQSSSIGPLAMASVSPDGKYLAVVPPGHDAVYIVALPGSATSFPKTPRLTTTGITALSWDRTDDLWVATGSGIDMLQPAGKGSSPVIFEGPGTVSDLSVAPDGIRIALIVQDGSRHELEVASIIQPQGPQTGPEDTAAPHVGPGTPLAPNLTRPVSLDWYSTDDLIALNTDPVSGVNALSEVPVDGQEAIPVVTPPGAASITAGGPANVLVAGITGGYLAVSPGPEGPWQQLANRGQDPAYP